MRLARENPRWGYQRIFGELNGRGMAVSATTVRKVLREQRLGPAGSRGGPSWREFLRAQAHRVIADVLNVLNDTAEESLAADNLFSPNFEQPTIFIDPRRAMLGVRLNLGR